MASHSGHHHRRQGDRDDWRLPPIKTLTEKLIGVSSADEVDAVASATVTSNAVKTALADCLRQAAGEEKTETALVDGVYTGEGRGFNLTQKVQVTVEIKDGKIVSVTVGDNGERWA